MGPRFLITQSFCSFYVSCIYILRSEKNCVLKLYSGPLKGKVGVSLCVTLRMGRGGHFSEYSLELQTYVILFYLVNIAQIATRMANGINLRLQDFQC